MGRLPVVATKSRWRAIIVSHRMMRARALAFRKRRLVLFRPGAVARACLALIGAEKAAEVILKGKLYSAQEALKLGLVDEISPRDQLLDHARKKLAEGKRKMEGRAPASPASQDFRASKQPGNAAPSRALEIINRTLSVSPDESLRMESTRLLISEKRNPHKI